MEFSLLVVEVAMFLISVEVNWGNPKLGLSMRRGRRMGV